MKVSDLVNPNTNNTPDPKWDFINYLDTSNLTKNIIYNVQKIPIGKYPSRAKRVIKKDDILFSTVRPNQCHYGIIKNILKNMVVSTGFTVLTVKDCVIPEYLYYYLTQNNIVKKLNTIAAGSTTSYPSINPEDILDIDIWLPKKISQKKIVQTLAIIDKKINLNSKINEELEQIAKALYDYWFVQFDFPNEEGKPYKAYGGEMEYNEVLKREIPKGWRVRNLASLIINYKNGDWGKEVPVGNYLNETICIRGTDIANFSNEKIINAPKRYILDKNKDKFLSEFDLIIEISGGSPSQSTGRIAYINKELIERIGKKIICSNFCKAITLVNTKYTYNFYLEWQRAYSAGVFFNYESKTTTLKNFMFNEFMNDYKIPIPNMDIIEKFYCTVHPLFKMIQKNAEQNQELIKMRDFLLPLLMNGQVIIK